MVVQMRSDDFLRVFDIDYPTWKLAARAIILSYQDFIVVTILLLVSLSVSLLGWRLRYLIILTHVILTVFIMFVGFINSIIQPIYKTPVNVSLLQYSGILHSGSASTLISYLSVSDLTIGFAILSVTPVVVSLSPLAMRTLNLYSHRLILLSLAAAVLYVFPSALATSMTMASQPAESGVIYLARSIYEQLPHINTDIANVAFDPYEVENIHDSAGARRHGSYIGAQGEGLPSIKNIVIFVLESVGAQYLDIYGGVPGTTPRLRSFLKQSILFTSGYAHLPGTPTSMFSILTSVQPAVDPHTLPTKNPRIGLPTLTMNLKRKGYQTGIFLSADSRYGKQDEFLHDRGIDTVQDARARSCTRSLDRDKFSWVTSDRCTAASMTEWIARVHNEPFFALMWTDQTHYPYRNFSAAGLTEESDYSHGDDKDDKTRYLQGIREADAIIGEFVESLEKLDLFRSTLIMVVGDHGEGFLQHGFRGHGTQVYDEFVRVPFLMINPVLFDGKLSHKNAGLIDVAPTILSLLGEKSPDPWQGIDLLSTSSRKYNFSFAPWGNFNIGYRVGNKRYIYDVLKDRIQAFDLEIDPREMQDIADTLTPAQIQEVKFRAAVFKSKQDQFFAQYDTGPLARLR
jgi:lipoteichoic acid synthase